MRTPFAMAIRGANNSCFFQTWQDLSSVRRNRGDVFREQLAPSPAHHRHHKLPAAKGSDMKTIGLIGGMSFESTAVYYRMINETVRARRGALRSADIVLHSVDFQDIVDLQKAGRWDRAGERLGAVAKGLENAGAACALICTNTMHLVADTVQAAISVPLINIIDETARTLRAAGRCRPLLLATRYTMEHGFYAKQMARHDVTVMVPSADDRTTVHDVIFDELCAGRILDASRDRLLATRLRFHRDPRRSRRRFRARRTERSIGHHRGLRQGGPWDIRCPPSPSGALAVVSTILPGALYFGRQTSCPPARRKRRTVSAMPYSSASAVKPWPIDTSASAGMRATSAGRFATVRSWPALTSSPRSRAMSAVCPRDSTNSAARAGSSKQPP
jgi:aspartate racemase